MKLNLILVCMLVVAPITIIIKAEHKVTLSILLESIRKCKEKNRSDADILGHILRMETLKYELNARCTVACVLKAHDLMFSNASINSEITNQALKLFELPLNTAQINTLVKHCADKLYSDRTAKRRAMSANLRINPDSDNQFGEDDSSVSDELAYTPISFIESKPNENNNNNNRFKENNLSQNDSQKDKPNPVSFIESKPSENNSNKSKLSRSDFNKRKSSHYKFRQNKHRQYKRDTNVVDECVEAAKFFQCFNDMRDSWGYL